MVIVMLLLGLAALTLGAEWVVRRASGFAAMFGISPLVVGLTVVAFGTSAPELVVSLQAALTGQPDVAVGNVLGSNIFNVLFILGLSALIVPLHVSNQLVRVDVPLMVALSAATWWLASDGRILDDKLRHLRRLPDPDRRWVSNRDTASSAHGSPRASPPR